MNNKSLGVLDNNPGSDLNDLIPRNSLESKPDFVGTLEQEIMVIKVKDVRSGDFNQAQRAMVALSEAGLDLELTAKALELGHGYERDEYHGMEPIRNLAVQGLKFSPEMLVGYQVQKRQLLLESSQNPADPKEKQLILKPRVLEVAQVVKDLELMSKGDNQENDSLVKIVAILSQKTHQISQ